MARGSFAALHAYLSHNKGNKSLRRRVISKCKGDKGSKGSYLLDRISLLPDEILISILSLLPLEEAARTCILSRRWKSLGVGYHRNLVFDGTRVRGRKKMVRWVHQVLQSHRCSTIDRFIVRLNLSKHSQAHLNKWLQLLSGKLNGIKSFELEFSPFGCHYQFDNMSLPSLPLAPFRSLTSLSLKSLNGSKGFVQGILKNCLLLENLCIANLEGPDHLTIPGSFLRLKYLEIVQWVSLKKVEVYAPNLSKFKYYGDKIELFFDKVTQLTHLSIGANFDHLGFAVDPLYSCFAQLKTLSLQPKFYDWVPLLEEPPHFPAMPNLNHLELEMLAREGFDLLDWASFIVRLPSLQTLKTRFYLFESLYNDVESKKPSGHPCSLKTLEIFGFCGERIDFDFVLYLVENAVELEKFVIGLDEFDPRPKSRKRAMQLKNCLRGGVIFELL